jgi:hypothetical protein
MLTMMRMMRILLGGFKGGNLYHNNLPGQKGVLSQNENKLS